MTQRTMVKLAEKALRELGEYLEPRETRTNPPRPGEPPIDKRDTHGTLFEAFKTMYRERNARR